MQETGVTDVHPGMTDDTDGMSSTPISDRYVEPELFPGVEERDGYMAPPPAAWLDPSRTIELGADVVGMQTHAVPHYSRGPLLIIPRRGNNERKKVTLKVAAGVDVWLLPSADAVQALTYAVTAGTGSGIHLSGGFVLRGPYTPVADLIYPPDQLVYESVAPLYAVQIAGATTDVSLLSVITESYFPSRRGYEGSPYTV